MNFKEYRKLTIKTMSDTGSKITDSVHMVLGMNTEVVGELPKALMNEDLVNFKEEIGDTFWYLANYCNIWNLDITEINPDVHKEIAKNLTPRKINAKDGNLFLLVLSIGEVIAEMQDLDKKELAYGKIADLNERSKHAMALFVALEAISAMFGANTNEIRNSNIDKLSARYPDLRFDAVKAVNRDLVVEREILER